MATTNPSGGHDPRTVERPEPMPTATKPSDRVITPTRPPTR